MGSIGRQQSVALFQGKRHGSGISPLLAGVCALRGSGRSDYG
jgi:hypothetical protein